MYNNLNSQLLEKLNFLNRVNQEFCGFLSKKNNNMFVFHLLKRSSFSVFKTHFSEEFFVAGNQVQILNPNQLKNKYFENKPIEFENFKDFKLIYESISLSDFTLANKYSGNLMKREQLKELGFREVKPQMFLLTINKIDLYYLKNNLKEQLCILSSGQLINWIDPNYKLDEKIKKGYSLRFLNEIKSTEFDEFTMLSDKLNKINEVKTILERF